MKEKYNGDIFEYLNSNIPIVQETIISLLKTKINLAFPVGGQIVNEFLFELGNRIKQNRINDFVEELGHRTTQLEFKILNNDFISKDDFYDLTLKTFESAVKINSDEKRKALANIYISSIYGKNDLDTDLQLLFTDFIVTISPIQILILKFLNKNEEQMIEIASYENYYNKFILSHENNNLNKDLFKLYNTDLETKSLISMGAGLENFDSTQVLRALAPHKEPSIKLTTLGLEFLYYLNE